MSSRNYFSLLFLMLLVSSVIILQISFFTNLFHMTLFSRLMFLIHLCCQHINENLKLLFPTSNSLGTHLWPCLLRRKRKYISRILGQEFLFLCTGPCFYTDHSESSKLLSNCRWWFQYFVLARICHICWYPPFNF